MPAKKASKKVASDGSEAPAAKKAAKKAPSAAKKAAKKAAKAPAAPKKTKAAPAPEPEPVDLEVSAYLNYRDRLDKGLPGDSLSDWLTAENPGPA